MKSEQQAVSTSSSAAPSTFAELELHHSGVDQPIAASKGVAAVPNAFSTFFTQRYNGAAVGTARHPSINANSRVFVSISEFSANPTADRFIGSARMAVYNIAPFNGGFKVWTDVSWSSPLNVRIDVLVDP